MKSIGVLYFQYRAALILADRADSDIAKAHYMAEADQLQREAVNKVFATIVEA